MSATILVSHHSEPAFPLLSAPYVEICNVNQGQRPAGFTSYDDDFVDNISIKNKTYCELSPLYMYWKQGAITDLFGLAHYRRIFCLNSPNGEQGIIELPFSQRYDIATEQATHLNSYQNRVIVGTIYLGQTSIISQFQGVHPKLFGFFKFAYKLFMSMYPNMNDVEEFFGVHQHLNYCNMFIAPKNVVEEWCSIIFNFLLAIEDNAPKDISEYDFRWAGFFSERFFTYFVNVVLKNMDVVIKPIILFK